MGKRERTMSERAFWVRLLLTMALVAVPMGWLIAFYGAPVVAVLAAGIAAAVALLAIWDTSRFLPDGLIFWGRPKALRDEITGLYNPEGWEDLLASEEDRCRRYGLPASVVVIEVVSDEEPSIQRLAEVGGRIALLCRKHDVAAYLRKGTFGVLAVGSGAKGSEALVARLVDDLDRLEIPVRWGISERTLDRGLVAAWTEARARVASAPAADRPRPTPPAPRGRGPGN